MPFSLSIIASPAPKLLAGYVVLRCLFAYQLHRILRRLLASGAKLAAPSRLSQDSWKRLRIKAKDAVLAVCIKLLK